MSRKIKIARAGVLARKRVLCLCYTLLHERVFLHYFHLNQITSSQHLICVSFMRQLNQLKIQSTLHNIVDTYLKRFLVSLSSVSSNYLKSKNQNCTVLRKLLLVLLLLSSFLLLLFSLQLVLLLSSLLLDTFIISIVIYYCRIIQLDNPVYSRCMFLVFFVNLFFKRN